VSNYLIGNDPSKWHTNIANYAKARYRGVYRGVDLVYHGDQKQLEYDLVVEPGANPGAIRLAFDGIQGKSLEANGNLVLHTSRRVGFLRRPRFLAQTDRGKIATARGETTAVDHSSLAHGANRRGTSDE
jgi:hypothetical protein